MMKPTIPGSMASPLLLVVMIVAFVMAPFQPVAASAPFRPSVVYLTGQPEHPYTTKLGYLDPVKITFSLEGKTVFFYGDRYDGELDLDVRSQYRFKVLTRQDGSFEALSGRKIGSDPKLW